MNFSYQINSVFRRIELIFCVAICLTLIVTSKVNRNVTDSITLFFVDISTPIVKVSSAPFNSLISSFSDLNALVNARAENKVLREENDKLKSLYIKSLNISQENKELKDLVNFVGMKSAKYHVARFIGYSHQLYSHNAFIDGGFKAGIKEDSIVIGKDSLIGRVIQVGQDKSRVLLVTDINSRIPIITSKSRVRGVLVGNNTDLMEILYLDNSHGISAGDMVFTSGDGDSLPPGILVGVVKKVNQSYVAVKMVEDIDNLNVVAVVEY